MEWNLKLTSNFLHSLLSPDILMPCNSVFPNVTYVMRGANSELEELDPIAKLRISNRVSFFCSFFFFVSFGYIGDRTHAHAYTHLPCQLIYRLVMGVGCVILPLCSASFSLILGEEQQNIATTSTESRAYEGKPSPTSRLQIVHMQSSSLGPHRACLLVDGEGGMERSR